MTEIPECPICGKQIKILEGVLGYLVGCPDCNIMVPTFTGPGLIIPNGVDREEYQRKYEEHLYSIWEDVNRKTTILNSLKMENVLRTAYGLSPVTYLDFVERDILRENKE